MADIDDQAGKIEEHYFGDNDPARAFADTLTEKGLLPYIPKVGWLLAFIFSFIKSRSQRGTLLSLCKQILDLCKAQGKDIEELKKRIHKEERMLHLGSVAVERTFWGASERRVQRFAAVVAGTYVNATTDQQYEDAAYFIRALDELSEDDIRVLKHLYKHQKTLVIENYAMPYASFFPQMNNMLMGFRELGMQMDDIFARCNHLTGYGLAIELDFNHASMTNRDDFAFRMTLLGKRLMTLLEKAGEDMDAKHR